jgi:hypothetical protein
MLEVRISEMSFPHKRITVEPTNEERSSRTVRRRFVGEDEET